MQTPKTFGSRTEVVSSLPSAANTRRRRTRAAVPAAASPLIKRRLAIIIIRDLSLQSGSRFQLAFELVKEAPVRAVDDDLLRARLDEARFAHAQGVEPERIIGIVFAPFVVRVVVQSLQCVVVALRETAIDELPRGTRRIAGAQIGGLQDCPQHPFARDRVLAHEFAIAGEQATEILRPRPI